MNERVPERIAQAVELLDLTPEQRILEIGCGPGVAASLICARLGDGGHLTAIDRSATAIERASGRNAAALAAGTLDLRHGDLAGLALDGEEPFDTVFAVNVNLFWTGPADVELELIARVLRPGGRLALVYETPRGTLSARAQEAIDGALRAHGFRPMTVAAPPVVAVIAQR